MLILYNLTNLVNLHVIDMYNWTGAFPEIFFQHPRLRSLYLEGNIDFSIPQTISAPLFELQVNGMNYTGPLTDAINYAPLRYLCAKFRLTGWSEFPDFEFANVFNIV
jgi:hypothetical protein